MSKKTNTNKDKKIKNFNSNKIWHPCDIVYRHIDYIILSMRTYFRLIFSKQTNNHAIL